MKNRNAKREASVRNSAYTAFLCAVLGSLLLELCIFQLHGKPPAYVTSIVIGLVLSATTWRRAAPYWIVFAEHARGARIQKDSKSLYATDFVSGLVLAGLGYLGASLALSGWFTPVSAFAVCLFFFPWSRVSLFYHGMLLPTVVIGLGAAVPMFATAQLPHPIMLLPKVWVLWLTSILAWVHLLVLRTEKHNLLGSAPHKTAETPDSVTHS